MHDVTSSSPLLLLPPSLSVPFPSPPTSLPPRPCSIILREPLENVKACWAYSQWKKDPANVALETGLAQQAGDGVGGGPDSPAPSRPARRASSTLNARRVSAVGRGAIEAAAAASSSAHADGKGGEEEEEEEEEDADSCCVCGDTVAEEGNDIVFCDGCNQGYHQTCHKPNITEAALDQEQWFCSERTALSYPTGTFR